MKRKTNTLKSELIKLQEENKVLKQEKQERKDNIDAVFLGIEIITIFFSVLCALINLCTYQEIGWKLEIIIPFLVISLIARAINIYINAYNDYDVND